MKKFILLLISLCVAVLVADRAIGWGLWQVVQRTHATLASKTRTLVYETDADIVCFGTSRCYHHYDPMILSDSLGMSVYNGGIDGSEGILAHYILASIMMERHKPKYAIVDIWDGDFNLRFNSQTNPYTSMLKFAPYYGKNVKADSAFALTGEDLFYRMSHVYRYNNQLLINFLGLFKDEKTDYCGYSPLGESRHEPFYSTLCSTEDFIDPTLVEYIYRFIDLCRKNNVTPILVTSPYYANIDSLYYRPLRRIAEQADVLYLDYHTNDSISQNSKYFCEPPHMNEVGATLFSKRLASDLKEKLVK